MFRFGMKPDTIQFGLLLISGIAMLSGFAGWASSYFAKVEVVQALSRRVDGEVEERRELKSEVDAIYLKLIPQPERIIIRRAARVRGPE